MYNKVSKQSRVVAKTFLLCRWLALQGLFSFSLRFAFFCALLAVRKQKRLKLYGCGQQNIAVLPFKHKDAALKLPICCIYFTNTFFPLTM